MRRIQQHLAHRRGHELPQLRSADGVVVRLEHLSAPPAQVVDQRLQSSFALGRATEQLPHLLHPEGGVQMTDRMRRDVWQISLLPPTFVAMTGILHAIASRSVELIPSTIDG